tara:strand:- start:6645 stop:7061 length:417 start_codon:yes stop_codon:yes gene_type:complete
MITCDQCPDSVCCRDVTVEIDEPEDMEDWDEIRWMVGHKNVAVYKDDDDDWVIEFKTPCDKLDERGKCTIYHERPKTCRDHEVETCVYNGEGEIEKIRFDNMEQVEAYVEQFVKPKLLKELKKEVRDIENWEWGKEPK